MATPFDSNPAFRKVTYKAQWIANGILAVLGAYFAATVDSVNGLPNWYVVALAVLPVLWTYLGVQADTNTSAPPSPYNHRYEGGYAVLGLVGAVLLIAAVVLLLTTLLKVFIVSIPVLVVVAVIGVILLFLDGRAGGRRF